MKTIDRLKECFFNHDYYISIYPNHIYIVNYIEILDFANTLIKLRFNSFSLLIKGLDFKITRKTKNEIDVCGLFSSMELLND